MSTTPGLGRVWLITALLLVPPVLALWLGVAPAWRPWLSGWITLLSLTTFVLYGWDKRRAIQGGERTPESTLHLLALFGGWPGALLAQPILRHKRAKRSFQVVFWLIVAAHEYAAIDLLAGWPLARLIARSLSG